MSQLQNKKLTSTILIILLIYARCVLGATHAVSVEVNLLLDGLAVLYCAYLAFQEHETLKKALISPAMLWLVAFTLLVFVYGHFAIRTCMSELYSMRFVVLTLIPPIVIFIMLMYSANEITDILAFTGAVLIPAVLVTTIIYDSESWEKWFAGDLWRFGLTPAGTYIDTGNLYMLLLIPVLYKVLVSKEIKAYLWAAVLGVVGIFLTGSKSSIIPIVVVAAIFIIGSAKNKKAMRLSLIGLVVFVAVAIVLCLTVPLLYEIVGDRFLEMFRGVGSTDYDLHTSTGQRMAIFAAFREHFSEFPIFGHGFYSFIKMPYSLLEQYHENGQDLYRNIQTHNNFMELAFSFGIFGLAVYYWFPVKLVIDSIKSIDKEAKLMGLAYLCSFFFMDMGLDMFYKYMTPYFVYLVVYCFVKRSKK